LRLLFDECLHTSLRALAHEAMLEAEHVNFLAWSGTQDSPLLEIVLRDEWTLVTNNGPDFTRLIRKKAADGLELHPGLILFMANVRPDLQRVLMQATLDYLEGREDLINRVLEVDLDPATKAKWNPQRRMSEDEWSDLAEGLEPEFTEYDLP